MSDLPVTLITGGGSGIGAATARQLLHHGHRVTVTGRGADRLHRFARDLGGLLTIPGDAADYAAVLSAVDRTLEEFGRLDVVVANARYTTFDDLATVTPAGGGTWS